MRGARRKYEVTPKTRATRKRIAYNLINQPTPSAILMNKGSAAVKWMAPATIIEATISVNAFLAWANERGVEVLSDCSPELLEEYHTHVLAMPWTASRKSKGLLALWRLHLMSGVLPAQDRLCKPPWSINTKLRREGGADGSRIPVIEPETMDSLLTWALTFVRDLSPDILAAQARLKEWEAAIPVRIPQDTHNGRYRRGEAPQPKAAIAFLRQYLDEHDGVLPGWAHNGRTAVAWGYLGARYGHQPTQLRTQAHRLLAGQFSPDETVPMPINTPVRSTVHGYPWALSIDYRDVVTCMGDPPRLIRLLHTACVIVLIYLTGMRPHEMLSLKTGCLEVVPEERPGGIVAYLVHGEVKKGRKRNGERYLHGDPSMWVTLKPGADAIELAEIMRTNEYLFPGVRGSDGPATVELINRRIVQFVQYVNEQVIDWGLPSAFTIPDDLEGSIRPQAFRRSLAWHIEAQPEGEIALTLQYQQVNSSLGRDGYSALHDVGVRRMMSAEAAAAQDQTMQQVGQALTQGSKVSGPAAEALMRAAALRVPVLATFVSRSEGRQIINDPDVNVYDNPGAYSLCVHRPEYAKCGTGDSPDRGACQADCANHARTDKEIDRLREHRDQHRAEVASPLTPVPLKISLTRRIEHNDALIEAHEIHGLTVRSLPKHTSEEGDRS
ncbi:hypothetical protein QN354_01250 [Cryobacterium sp. 5I3]|uniref:hypothetical protein n=1 Tax=unclassified Cryobacterium TaxID=2649013 RepID=UPI002B2289D6|nr:MULTISPECIES: hypothetical protein [unclassified Cryobacterium]MEB0200380.1 hypothetical protein [Cryobacterium sp. 5I3]